MTAHAQVYEHVRSICHRERSREVTVAWKVLKGLRVARVIVRNAPGDKAGFTRSNAEARSDLHSHEDVSTRTYPRGRPTVPTALSQEVYYPIHHFPIRTISRSRNEAGACPLVDSPVGS